MKITEMKTEKIRFLPTEILLPNAGFSRRMGLDPELECLADSIRRYGILQPLLVQKRGGNYYLLCGSRRLRAARLLGLAEVPCRILNLSPREADEIVLAENLNRQAISPCDEALTAARLLKEHPYRQGELARRIGESPSELASKLRLLRFTEEERRLLSDFALGSAYLDALLHLRDSALRLFAIERIGRLGMSPEEARELCLSLALHPEEFIPPLRPKAAGQKKAVRRFVVKDVRFFVNSVDRAIHSIREAGYDVESEKTEEEEYISYSIRIPK